MADPATVSIVIPAKDEAESITDVVGRLREAAPWREIIVVDDGSSDATAARARDAGACVIRHPYNKGNGAAVKTGTRHASGEFVLHPSAQTFLRAGDVVRVFGLPAQIEAFVSEARADEGAA